MKYFTLLVIVCIFFSASCSKQDTSQDNFNIILITIDALRADHLSCYGYDRKTSPAIDKIAERGIIFKNAIAPSSWTAPSMASLFTSVYPINHGVVHGINYIMNKTIHVQEVFSDELTTLAEILQQHDYTTFGVTSNLHLSEKFGFARGFDYFNCLPWSSAPRINREIYLWEDTIKESKKFFLWVHYFDPHHPYLAKKPWIENYTSQALTKKLNLPNKSSRELTKLIPTFKKDPQALSNLMALYDSEINFVDSYVGELIQKYELNNNTLIIITSDHGEEFVEHGQRGHGKNLFQETIHIPLIVKLPFSSKKHSVEKPVSLIDIMPSIFHMLKINFPEQALGRYFWKEKEAFSWLKKMLLRRDVSPDYNFSELDTHKNLKTIITPEWKYIYNYNNRMEQLYNIRSDPSELNNLAAKETKQCNLLQEELFAWSKNAKAYPAKDKSFEITEEDKRKLEALGYLTSRNVGDENQDSIFNEKDNYWFEAEHADTIIAPFEVAFDENASNRGFIFTQNGTGNEYSEGGTIMATYTVNIFQAGIYILWGRVSVFDKRDNSFFVQVDDGLDNLWEVEAGASWHWDKVNDRDVFDPVRFVLTSGVHTIRIKLREDGTKLDKLLLTNNVNFVPSGKGDIAENTGYSEDK